MYGILTYIYHKIQPNVVKYTSRMDHMGIVIFRDFPVLAGNIMTPGWFFFAWNGKSEQTEMLRWHVAPAPMKYSIFTPIPGEMIQFDKICSPNGLVQPPTRDLLLETMIQFLPMRFQNLEIHTQHCGAIINGHQMNIPSNIIFKTTTQPPNPLPTTKNNQREKPKPVAPFFSPMNFPCHHQIGPPKDIQ